MRCSYLQLKSQQRYFQRLPYKMCGSCVADLVETWNLRRQVKGSNQLIEAWIEEKKKLEETESVIEILDLAEKLEVPKSAPKSLPKIGKRKSWRILSEDIALTEEVPASGQEPKKLSKNGKAKASTTKRTTNECDICNEILA